MGIRNLIQLREGADTDPWFRAGVPQMRNEIKDNASNDFYFSYHHSAADTMSIMDAEDMDDNVIMIASMMYLIADLDVTLPQ